jgi:hypothetical protein
MVMVIAIAAVMETGGRVGASMRGGTAGIVSIIIDAAGVAAWADVDAFVDEGGGGGAVSGAHALSHPTKSPCA